MSTERFYADIKAFSDFQTLGEDQHDKPLPSDWSVVISDVRGSTKAIEQGRYQDRAPGTKAIAFIRGGGLSWADAKISLNLSATV